MHFTTEARRARLVARHHLDGSATDPLQAATDVVVLHATDPATVYLSVLARCPDATLGDVSRSMYDDRRLVRMLAMRRTLFVVPYAFAPVVHHAAGLDIAAKQRRLLVKQLQTIPTEPPLPEDVEGWLADVESSVERALTARGEALANALSTDEPRLRTSFLPTTDKAYDVKRTITSQVLTVMAAEGRIVRSAPRGGWLVRQHTWQPATSWWPEGLPEVPDAPARLVERYLSRFGPATADDVQWWTGWTVGATRAALSALDTVDVESGLVLAHDVEPDEPGPPSAVLLPALDPTPMGWKERGWFLPEDPAPFYDRSGNVGPTVWWGGEVVGGWAIRPDGVIATRLVVDRGAGAEQAVTDAADALQARLEGGAVIPSFPTPLEKELRTA
jgi:hypothetical protein